MKTAGILAMIGVAALALLGGRVATWGAGETPPAASAPSPLKAILLTPEKATSRAVRTWKAEGYNAVTLVLDERTSRSIAAASRRVRAANLALYYWIEVGRNPAMADAHPEWMASLQGHREWRRHFPKAPQPADGEVVKNYPWVPIVYRESFDAHVARVTKLLQGKPAPAGVFLNDLQAAPSACGCGNTLCRWTPDYGPIRTATRLPADAAARFVAAVSEKAPGVRVIPVWTPECEAHDTAKDGACAGVGCYSGDCWYEYTAQLMPLAKQSATLATLLPYRALGRDLSRYGPTAGWIGEALRSFAVMPLKRRGEAISADRLIAVLQGWDVTPEQEQAQIRQASAAGAAGYLLARAKIEQGWEPRLLTVNPPPRPR